MIDKKSSLLLIDANEFEHLLFEELLEDSDIGLIKAKDQKDAMHHIHSNTKIKLVFLNIRLADTDGFKLLHDIKQITPSLPVVAYTAVTELKTLLKCIDAGFEEVIIKPVELPHLLQTIRKYWVKSRVPG